MRAFLPDYPILSPRGLPEALHLLAEHGATLQPLAGGTDIGVTLAMGTLPRAGYLNLRSIKELCGIDVEESHITIRALTTYSAILKTASIKREFPNLWEAARLTAAVAIQNRGTLAGNIANASPAADSCPALLVYDADILLESTAGERWVPYNDFHTGYKATQRRPDELITAIRLHRRNGELKNAIHYYRKVGTRDAQAIAKVNMAAVGRVVDGGIDSCNLALGSVAPLPLRCPATETALVDKPATRETWLSARDVLFSEITPIDDIRSSRDYRLWVAGNLLEEFVSRLAGVESLA